MSSSNGTKNGRSPLRNTAAMVTRRLSGFAASTLITGVAGVAAVPLAIGGAGSESWARLAAGQTIGGLFAIVVALGWGITGPAQVAALTPALRWAVYRHSVEVRAILLAPLVAGAFVVTAFVVPGDSAALVGAAAQCSAGLAAGWFFVGAGRPGLLIIAETLPRALATITGATLTAVTEQIMWLAGGMLVAGLLIPVLSTLVIRFVVPRGGRRLPLRFWATARDQLPAASTVLVSASYMALPLIVVAAVSPQALVVFALADRLYKLATTALSPFGQVAQGWVPAGGPAGVASRARQAARVAVALAVFIALGFATLAPVFGAWLSGGEVSIPTLLAALLGIALGASFIAQIVGIACLIAAGLIRWVFVSAVAGGTVGTVVLVLGVPVWGSLGAAAAVGAAELVVAATQLIVFRLWLKEGLREAAAPGPLQPPTEVLSFPSSLALSSSTSTAQVPADLPLTVSTVTMATVTYGARHESCILTCEAAMRAGVTSIVIVANGVRPESLLVLRDFVSSQVDAKLVERPTNEGSAPGFGRAIEEAVAGTGEYVWLLDDDNVPEPNALRLALEGQAEWAALHHIHASDIAVACYRPGDPMQARLFGAAAIPVEKAYNAAGSFLWRATFRRRIEANVSGRWGALSVPSAPYGGLLMPKAMLARMGPPREDFVLYQDDTEYTERLRHSGFELILVPNARVLDPDRADTLARQSDGMQEMLENAGVKPVASYYMLRNSVMLDVERAKRARAYPLLIANATLQLAAMVITSFRSPATRAGGRVAFRAISDGLRGRVGRTRDLA